MGSVNPFLIIQIKKEISTTLMQPLLHTQRIKFLSLDVSESYITLGASSGGLYIFEREPCSFLQIIPGQGGSINLVQIAPNEKMFAFATNRGLFCVLQYLKATKSYNVQVHREHIGSTITAIKWNIYSNEVFVGDMTGKLSVVTFPDIITKTMFQVPCFPLMKLESQIVQLDWSCNLLLVSTLTRCYICDTEKEEYRQIGQKLRDGDYGACFVNINESTTSLELTGLDTKKMSLFHNIGEKPGSFRQHTYFQRLKIYCARPGARLWEVLVDGTVVKTHQYKNALSTASSCVMKYSTSPNERLRYIGTPEPPLNQQNFSKVLTFKKKYLLSFKSNYIFVLDPEHCSALFWIKLSKEIIDMRIYGSYLYVWNAQEVDVLFITSVEKCLIKCFVSNQYLLCADICIENMAHLLQVIPYSNKLYLLKSLADKLKHDVDLVNALQPLLDKIELCLERKKQAQMLESGIFVVDNDHYTAQQINSSFMDTPDCIAGDQNSTNETIETFREIGNSVTKSLQAKWHKIEDRIFKNQDHSCPQLGTDDKYKNSVLTVPSDESVVLDSAEITDCKDLSLVKYIDPSESQKDDEEQKLHPEIKIAFARVNEQPKLVQVCKSTDTFLDCYNDTELKLINSSLSKSTITTCSRKVGSDTAIIIKDTSNKDRIINSVAHKNITKSSISIASVQNKELAEEMCKMFAKPIAQPVPIKSKPSRTVPSVGSSDTNTSSTLDYPAITQLQMQIKTVQVDGGEALIEPSDVLCLYEQYKLSRISNILNNPAVDEVLKQISDVSRVNKLIQALRLHLEECPEFDVRSVERWCSNLLLRYIEISNSPKINIADLPADLINCIFAAYTELNCSSEMACKCGFPFPKASSFTVLYYDIGVALIDLWWQKNQNIVWDLCRKVPYSWKQVIPYVEKRIYIPLLVQYHDEELLKSHMKKFVPEQYPDVIRYFIKMKLNICLKCDTAYEESGSTMSWSNFAFLLLRTTGSIRTVEYLIKYSQYIPTGALNPVFFQICLLSSLMKETPIDEFFTTTNELSDVLENLLAAHVDECSL